MTSPQRTVWFLVASISIVVGGVIAFRWGASKSPASLMHSARQAADRRDWPAAVRIARQAAQSDPEAWWWVGQWSARSNQFAEAIAAWEQIPHTSGHAGEARIRAAELAFKELRQLHRAEQNYRQALLIDNQNSAALDGLAQTLAVAGRWRELAPVLLRLIQLDAYSNFYLDLLARGSDINVDPQVLLPVGQESPDDVSVVCARIRLKLQSQQVQEAKSELDRVLREKPNAPEVQLLYGETLSQMGDMDPLRNWLLTVRDSLQNDPDYWRLAFGYCNRRREEPQAARCAWELLRRDPLHVAATLTLGRILQQSGEIELAARLTERAQRLEQYAASVASARKPQNWGAIEHCVQLAEQLGLIWEAWGWSQLASRLNPRLTWMRAALQRIEPQLAALPLERTAPQFNLADQVAGERFPLPIFRPDPTDRKDPVSPSTETPLTFRDDAERCGLHFQYENGGNCLVDGLRFMHEMTGGGVSALDFDRDQWPDLYFSQGGEFSLKPNTMAKNDRLWRNRDGAAWEDVTLAAGLSDEGFGQGVCVGDLDQDGFPDLLVLNIGLSVLWHNQGDGTFTQVAAFREVVRPGWNLSAGIADLDGDSIPDIYLVNYLAGDDVFTKICPDAQGVLRLTCQPLIFPAAADQLLRGLGDGRFEDVTTSAEINRPAARGMGLVIGRLSQSESLEVFVANDSTANNHYIRQSATGDLRYADDAFRLGTAVDVSGRAQACMGIAVDDVDGDGRIDLLVTNFEDESNTLYQQLEDGLFADRSREWGVDAPSRPMLGFGTQFLDADLDGDPELIVANGHVNDRREAKSQYQMPPQLFRNQDGSRFQQVPPEEAGDYFHGRYLGRGLAVLDWNRDGLPDVTVSHLDRPASVLTNQSQRRGRWLQVHCVGTKSARDPIGTKVIVPLENRTVTRQLLAGDGYASANQRMIVIGLGDVAPDPVDLEVEWPDGTRQTVKHVPVDHGVVVIEGRESAIPLSN